MDYDMGYFRTLGRGVLRWSDGPTGEQSVLAFCGVVKVVLCGIVVLYNLRSGCTTPHQISNNVVTTSTT
jgi:hypothetical protein